ncbi:SGNH/GDSL hydrolase family protein [Streptomyces rishiriensis]|uniref:Lysophospholipase L1-like esterase n=1 Tax=Streptomyces rishiriensis TaxID=68264 RepID=A0ABU0NQM9_STRRH|nr:SGNH/GDSL hydrolase family protein [Streptomyces rishiriensis]MDQ0581279.1 lysophospholipase L1-like esterase [Streptomyces rishiriensis]
MTRRHGYALLSAITALIVGLSAAIYASAASDHGPGLEARAAGPAEVPGPGSAAPISTGVWVGTWAAAPVSGEPGTATDGMAGRTVRNVVHTSVGGTSARVTLSNLYGVGPLTVTHATLAVATGDGSAAAVADSLRRLTFGGATTVVVPPGGQTVSDAVTVAVPSDSDVLVSTYSPTSAGPVTYHPHARQTNYVAEGESTEDVTGAAFTGAGEYWRYLTALDVLSNRADGTVVALGDSITDGVTSTAGANRRWPDVLAGRLRASVADGGDTPRYGVVNEGISGNRVLTDDSRHGAAALNRFERDVLGRTNVKAVVIDLGINDILRDPGLADPQAVVDGLRTLVERAHAHGIRVIGTTLTPFRGHRGYSDGRENVRQLINQAIRADAVFDTVVDLDRALRDPYDPRSLRPEYDSGDHLHPSDRGYRKMARTIDLTELDGPAPARL